MMLIDTLARQTLDTKFYAPVRQQALQAGKTAESVLLPDLWSDAPA